MKARLFMSFCIVLLAALSWCRVVVDEPAEAYVDDALQQATVVFATTRLLNGIVSVAQGTEVGVGVDIAVGEILDPLNDLLERFSWVMLASLTSLGIQKLLIAVGGATAVNAVCSILALLFVVMLWQRRWRHGALLLRVARLTWLMLVLRYAMLVALLANQFVYQQFMADDYQRAQQGLQRISMQVGDRDAGQGMRRDEPGWFSSFWERLSASDRFVDELMASASALVSHVLALIVVFVFQTMVVPLLFLWGLLRVLGFVARGRWLENITTPGARPGNTPPQAPRRHNHLLLPARRERNLPLQ